MEPLENLEKIEDDKEEEEGRANKAEIGEDEQKTSRASHPEAGSIKEFKIKTVRKEETAVKTRKEERKERSSKDRTWKSGRRP